MLLNEYLMKRTGIEFLEAKIISKLYFNEYYEEIMDLDLIIIKGWLEKEIQKIQKELEARK